MKLLTVKKRKIAVLLTGGLGDNLLFIPLLKQLKKKGYAITCIFYAKYKNDCLLDNSLFDRKQIISSKLQLVLFGLTHIKQFANVYVNHFGMGKLLSLTINAIAKKKTQTKKLHNNNKRNRLVISEFTDTEQNLYLLFSKENAVIKKITDFYLEHPIITNTFKLQHPYFVLQVTSGNNSNTYRNWPLKNWLSVIQNLCTAFPAINFVVVGDANEEEFKKSLSTLASANCKILIGETTIQDVFNIVANSEGYIGQDSGIMHLSVALKKKTLSIFGPSNEALYQYHIIDTSNHKVITTSISCRPCASWKNANTSRVSNPMQCPDFACLTTIQPSLVFEEIVAHFNL